jgi:hypothetical protein
MSLAAKGGFAEIVRLLKAPPGLSTAAPSSAAQDNLSVDNSPHQSESAEKIKALSQRSAELTDQERRAIAKCSAKVKRLAIDKWKMVSFKCPLNASQEVTELYPLFIGETVGSTKWGSAPPPVGTTISVGGLKVEARSGQGQR